MIVLDTNILSEMMRDAADANVLAWLDGLPAADMFTTAISIAELRFGIEALPDGGRKTALRTRFDAVVDEDFAARILAFDAAAAEVYGVLAATLRRSGRPIGVADAMIAAIAHREGAPVATRNVRHFEMTGVEIVNPFAAPA